SAARRLSVLEREWLPLPPLARVVNGTGAEVAVGRGHQVRAVAERGPAEQAGTPPGGDLGDRHHRHLTPYEDVGRGDQPWADARGDVPVGVAGGPEHQRTGPWDRGIGVLVHRRRGVPVVDGGPVPRRTRSADRATGPHLAVPGPVRNTRW